ncbi:hypothetical protein B0H14DRAFT_2785783 [Mycena olivaceomarginata]|nr:hypothetical protein B0H14DRAFT_2785783 [Mycena olivaceomarginata]
MVSRDLACRFLQLMQQIGRGERPMMLWHLLETPIGDGHEWGCHIRSSPQQDPELLQKLDQFVPPWDVFSKASVCLEPVEFYDVIQWLKTFPNPQPNLIDRWQGYLTESIVQKTKSERNPVDYSDDALEERWKYHLENEVSFHGPSQEEVIQIFESVLRKARIQDEGDGNEDSNASDSDEGSEDSSSSEDGSDYE